MLTTTTKKPPHFQDFLYQRPDIDAYQETFERNLKAFNEAGSYEEQSALLETINLQGQQFNSMYNLCYIRHSIDVADPFYLEEKAFFDQYLPVYQSLDSRFHDHLLLSPFRRELEQKWGPQLFRIAELNRKISRPEVLEDLQEENRLITEYVRLKASAEIEFRGKVHNLSTIIKEQTSPDREIRYEASLAKWQFFEKNEAAVDAIFDQLVKTRHRIAQKLGYSNFVALGYDRMLRSDFNADQVRTFRDQIARHFVPLASACYERQRRRLNLDKLLFHDEDFRFTSGNPEPKGAPDWIVQQAGRMYRELSTETGSFFDFMLESGLMDLESKPGKAPGGYCSFIPDQKAPFIFSNFNGTSGDVDVLTHECGHAFQIYSSRNLGISEYYWPTYEACEIHSMSMEFFAWPWLSLFFGEDAEKFRFNHMLNIIYFLPYGIAVDEFQHFVYENPDISQEARKQYWKALEAKYLPHREYAGLPFLDRGTFWFKQGHIFSSPFYYIDYVLAEICALQFWAWSQEDHPIAWQHYLQLCQAGGSRSFLELVELAGLHSPFSGDAVELAARKVQEWLDGIDDTRF